MKGGAIAALVAGALLGVAANAAADPPTQWRFAFGAREPARGYVRVTQPGDLALNPAR